MTQNTYNVITTYISHDESFKIVKHDETGRYLAINTKYIDASGRITKELRGFEMFMSDTPDECLQRIETEFRKQEFEAEGYSTYAAIALAHGASVEEALEVESRMLDLL